MALRLSSIGIALQAAGLHGYLLRPMAHWQRALAIVAALFLVAPALIADLIGVGLAAAVLAVQYLGIGTPVPVSAGAAAVHRSLHM